MRQRFSLSVSVFVIVRSDDKVLLLRRANTGWKDGCYSLPAGGHDGGEPLTVAAVRELEEETGLLANPDDLQLVHLLHCAAGDSGQEWLGAFFHAGCWSGTPVLREPDRHDRLGWYPLGDLPGDTIAYTVRTAVHEIWAINPDGSNARRLAGGPGDNQGATWAPNGRHLAFQSSRLGGWQIFAMLADGSEQVQILKGPGEYTSPSWSPRLP